MGFEGKEAGFAEVERGSVGGVVEEEDGCCVVGFLLVVVLNRLGFVIVGRWGGGVGVAVGVGGGEMGEEDVVGVDVEWDEQCFWYPEGGRYGVVEDLGTVREGEDVDFEGGGGGEVEDREEVGVGGGGGRGEGCHKERAGRRMWVGWVSGLLGGPFRLVCWFFRPGLAAIQFRQDAFDSGRSVHPAARDPSGEYRRCAGDQ